MKTLCIWLLVGLACTDAQRNTDSKFVVTEIKSKRPQKEESIRDEQNAGKVFPDYFRVELEVMRLENEKGQRSDGKDCDSFNTCDPRIQVFMDSDKPLSPWPGSSLAKDYQWPIIFEASNVNSPTIGKSVSKDFCGGVLNKVNARVHVEDVDTGVSNDLINNFECLFTDDARWNIARDARGAEWSQPMECRAAFLPGRMKMLVRHREYEIPGASCQSQKDTSGSVSMNTDIRGVSQRFQPHTPGRHDLVRLDVELVQLSNPSGLTALKQNCDVGSTCDTTIYVSLDNDIPLAKWPGSKIVKDFTQLFSVTNQNSPVINKNVTKDFCGGAVGMVNLRANVVDWDTVSSSDPVGNFECIFNADYGNVARDISSSDWSATQDCKPLQDSDVRLQFRYRMYDISTAQCGIKG